MAEGIQEQRKEVSNQISNIPFTPSGPVVLHILLSMNTEKMPKPKKPKQPARKPIARLSSPPKKPRYPPSPKAAVPNKPKRRPPPHAASTYPSWMTMLPLAARPATSVLLVSITRWTPCR